MTRRPTMTDVARAAGVSIKTVSRVINGEPSVSAQTEARVQAAIAELGFRRNDVARLLRSGQASATIGLVIGDVSNPFYASMARAAEEVASERGSMLVTASSDEEPERERELVNDLLRRRVDGLLIVPAPGDHRYLRAELDAGTPIVFLDRPAPGVRADTVTIDNRRGARAGVAHLLDAGHRRIAFVSDPPSIATVKDRLAGYRDALSAAGLAEDPALVVCGPHDPAQAEAAAYELLDCPSPPDAFFCSNNRMTVGVLRALIQRGASQGVMGFDDFELADMLPFAFTVVSHSPAEMGRRGAALLLERVDGARPAKPRRVVLETTLVPRGWRKPVRR